MLLPDHDVEARLADPSRLAALAATGVIGAAGNAALDRLTRLACRILRAPTSLVSLLDADHQFHAAMHGLAGGQREFPLSHSFCKHVVAGGAPLVIDDTLTHEIRSNPSVALHGIKAYVGMPLVTACGAAVGALCVIDDRPHAWSHDDIETLRDLAACVMTEIALEAQAAAQRVVEAELRESEARFKALAQNLPGLLFQRRVKADGRLEYVFFSHADARVGDKSAQIGGDGLKLDQVFESEGMTVHEDDVPRISAALEESLAKQSDVIIEYRMIMRDGSVRHKRSHSNFRLGGGGEPLWDGCLFDITDLVEARTAAEAATRAQKDLVANVNHELRTPLNAILGYSELLQDESLPDGVRERARIIHRAGHGLLALVNQLLDSASAENGALRLDPAPHDPRDMLANCQALVQDAIRRQRVELDVSVAAGVPALILADGMRLSQVVVNLLSNAIKFTDGGHVAVALTTKRRRGLPMLLRCTVSDTGIGIARADQARLFERFSRVAEEPGRYRPGTGLGLSIARDYVEAMGGAIGVESEAGRGSTFWFEVPCVDVQPAEIAPAAPRRILVAEDARANQTLLLDLLTRYGYEVECVDNGARALQALAERTFDLVLMDMKMPVMNGGAAARAIRAMGGSAARTPIIALTADTGREAQEECAAAGMDAALSKPFDIKGLLGAVERWALLPQRAA